MPPNTEPSKLMLSRVVPHGPMLTSCSFPGCTTLTMGGTCVQHDIPVDVIFPRGRPYVPVRQEDLAVAAPH